MSDYEHGSMDTAEQEKTFAGQTEAGATLTVNGRVIPVDRKGNFKIVLDSIEELSPEARQVLVLRSIEDASYEDIAGVTGKSVHHVRSILHRARTKLKEIVKSRISGTDAKEVL